MATVPFPRPVKKIDPQNAKPDGKSVFAVDDGTREVTLVNTYGKVICRLHFRTGELAIMNRFNALTEDLPKIVEPLERVNLNPDGNTDENDDGWAVLKQVEGAIKQRINALLDMDEADEIFKTRSPFSSIGGVFFVERVLNAIGEAITAQIKEEAALSQARIAKYVDDVAEDEVSENAGATAENAND